MRERGRREGQTDRQRQTDRYRLTRRSDFGFFVPISSSMSLDDYTRILALILPQLQNRTEK